MIVKEEDGWYLDFKDWDYIMWATASRLFQLPLPPGRTRYDHEVGIDRLVRQYGTLAIDLLSHHVDEFGYCPNAEELLEYGQAVLATHVELIGVRQERKLERDKTSVFRRSVVQDAIRRNRRAEHIRQWAEKKKESPRSSCVGWRPPGGERSS